jgi:hypothetical protein
VIYGKENSRDELSERADPEEMSFYNTAKTLAKKVINNVPSRLLSNVMVNSYTKRCRDGQLLFYDTSKKEDRKTEL